MYKHFSPCEDSEAGREALRKSWIYDRFTPVSETSEDQIDRIDNRIFAAIKDSRFCINYKITGETGKCLQGIETGKYSRDNYSSEIRTIKKSCALDKYSSTKNQKKILTAIQKMFIFEPDNSSIVVKTFFSKVSVLPHS